MKGSIINMLKQLIGYILSLTSSKSAPISHKRQQLIPPIIQKLHSSGFKVNSFGDYDLNIVGIRTVYDEPNKFDDYLYCIYKVNDEWVQHRWNITTDPGVYWLEHPLNKLGTACVVANRQYEDVWELGKHRGKYKALVQTGNKIAVYRDNDRNPTYDFSKHTIQEGYFGINCHRATTAKGGSVDINKWSAGCQVFQKPDDFKKFIELCEKQIAIRKWNKFNYTLLNQWCDIYKLDWNNEDIVSKEEA